MVANPKTVLTCKIDLSKNYPYRPQTFTLIRRLAPLIKRYSTRFGVPAVAIAGSIADEYNTRNGARKVLDWLQDQMIISRLPNLLIEIDAYLGFPAKLLNATRNDLGPGNINLATAKRIYERYQRIFPAKIDSWSMLVDYLLTDEGTVVVAALVIKKGISDMSLYIAGQPPELQEAILVTYYKQGPTYIGRFKGRLKTAPTAVLVPGEGCRVFHQRSSFAKILSVE